MIIPAITITEDSPKKSILVRDISTCRYLNNIASLDNKGSIYINSKGIGRAIISSAIILVFRMMSLFKCPDVRQTNLNTSTTTRK